MDYIVLGCLAIDNIVNAQGITKLNQFGGNAAYGGAGIHIWDSGEIGLVSRKGNDFPEAWIKELQDYGIDTKGIKKVDESHLMTSGMLYDSYGNREELVFNEDNQTDESKEGFPTMTPWEVTKAHDLFAPEIHDIPADYIGAAVMIGARHYDRQLSYANFLREQNPEGIIIMDTGKDYMKPEYELKLPELLRKVDVLLPSESEVCGLFGFDVDMEWAARRLCRMGAKAVVIKLGVKGCLIYQAIEDKIHYVPVFPANVQDPTGAGDSFCGGFLAGLKESGDLIQAAMYGAVSASFIIEHFGVEAVLKIKRHEALKRLDYLRTVMNGGNINGK